MNPSHAHEFPNANPIMRIGNMASSISSEPQKQPCKQPAKARPDGPDKHLRPWCPTTAVYMPNQPAVSHVIFSPSSTYGTRRPNLPCGICTNTPTDPSHPRPQTLQNRSRTLDRLLHPRQRNPSRWHDKQPYLPHAVSVSAPMPTRKQRPKMSHPPATGCLRWQRLPPQSPVLEVDATSSPLSSRSVTRCKPPRALHGPSRTRPYPWGEEHNDR